VRKQGVSIDRAFQHDKQLVVMMLGINLSQLLHGCAARLQALTMDTAVDGYANSCGTLFVFVFHDNNKSNF